MDNESNKTYDDLLLKKDKRRKAREKGKKSYDKGTFQHAKTKKNRSKNIYNEAVFEDYEDYDS